MSSRYEKMKKLFWGAAKNLYTEKGYKEFLTFASRFHKYRFESQLSIYSQKPDATACASMPFWNRTMKMLVNAGAMGIGLVNATDQKKSHVDYVFDVSDVHKTNESIPDFKLWEYHPEIEENVIDRLCDKFSVMPSDIDDVISQIVILYTQSFVNAQDDDFEHLVEGLEGTSREYATDIIKNLIMKSAKYMICRRCGLPYIGAGFPEIRYFRDFHAVSHLCDLNNRIARDVIDEISISAKEYEKTLEKEPQVRYNALKRRSESGGGKIDGTDVQKSGGRLSSEPGSGRGSERVEEMGTEKDEIPQGASERNLQHNADGGYADETRSGSPGGRRTDGREIDQANEGKRGDNGRIETARYDEVGRHDEQYQGIGGGDNLQRADLRLEKYDFDTETEEKHLPFFNGFAKVLLQTPFLKAPHEEIIRYYENEEDKEKRIEFIKEIFNNEHCSFTLDDGRQVSYKTYSNGVKFWEGPHPDIESAAFHRWGEIAGAFNSFRITKMISVPENDASYTTVDGQLSLMGIVRTSESSEKRSIFTDEAVDEMLRSMARDRVYKFFSENHGDDEIEKFLKEQYGMGGSSYVLPGMNIWKEYDSKGVTFDERDSGEKHHLSWKKFAKKTKALIDAGKYFDQKQLDNYYNKFLPQEEERAERKSFANEMQKICHAFQDAGGELNTYYLVSDCIGKYVNKNRTSHVRSAAGDDVLTVLKETMETIAANNSELLERAEKALARIISEMPQEEMDEYKAHVVREIEQEAAAAGMTVDEYAANGYEPRTDEFIEETQVLTGNEDLIGKKVFLDGREFVIESVGGISGDVSMRDITFENENGYPINRVIKADLARWLVENIQQQEIGKASVYDFDYSNVNDEKVGKKVRFRRNADAITLLKRIEAEGRMANSNEQMVLANYVGWGGIPEAFDANNEPWKSEYEELKSLLSEEEYQSAKGSTLTAFYTPKKVIEAVYDILKKTGYTQGNILEPGCGIGNFIGMLPDEMQDSKMYGIEIDPISARIAQQLYQSSRIINVPFEKTELDDDFFDVVIGNVPFNNFKVNDKKYNKHNFLIHDYFFAKSLDKLRPGGLMMLITSKGTMDKKDPSFRKYMANRAELIGAIRLPESTFDDNAGTQVTSDILIFQKRDRIMEIEPSWVHLDVDEAGIAMNSYFVDHPEMIAGKMTMKTGQYGEESACISNEGISLEDELQRIIPGIDISYRSVVPDMEELEDDGSILADPDIKNFSYTIYNDKVYFREGSLMSPVKVPAKTEERIRGMIELRDSVRELIDVQTEGADDQTVEGYQKKLNEIYNEFTDKYGFINSRGNNNAFSDDSSYFLLTALEEFDSEGKFIGKTDLFYKRTIRAAVPVTQVDTASDALTVSIAEKAGIDMEYMCDLSGMSEEDIYDELKGVIFLNPEYNEYNDELKYFTSDAYLSGNVRKKLAEAKMAAEVEPAFVINVEFLEKVQPKELDATEITAKLGSSWIPEDIIQQFVFELLEPGYWAQQKIKVKYIRTLGEWRISNKSYDQVNVKANRVFGTSRKNAYDIIESTLNLRTIRINDYVEDADGKKRAVLNRKETAIVQSKQEQIKQEFDNWIWADIDRRERLEKIYNELFNSTRPRKYDGSKITFNGMNPEIVLKEHQKNAVAHILYGDNTLLAHCVGAGKTFEMVAAAQESKRLGLCTKSMFVVPNHLTEQWASEYLRLYPSANILVSRKKDFETKNRKKFCSRIATGDYDAVIIGHTQFEKIPLGKEHQIKILQGQLDDIMFGLEMAKRERGESFTVKQYEKARASIEAKLERLNDEDRKDDVITFEQLGVDRLFIDESHYFKNLFLYTKMRNVAGIAQTEAMKSQDLFMKCRYLDEKTGGKGICFATGTPISNSMVELYTLQRYLQYDALKERGHEHFDAWAADFGETVDAIELAPEGTSYRVKKRFAKFFNLPELMTTFKEVADIQTADMLNLPVPKANYINVSSKASYEQEKMVEALAERAEKIRAGTVESTIDNMLKVTNDGRKLALDQRLINDMLPDHEDSKLNKCIENVYSIWQDTADNHLTQLIFCDMSTPKSDGSFNVYDDVRDKLLAKGIPENEIEFIHNAGTETKKAALFKKVREGKVRILLGSTQKMGAGTNVQDKLIAIHRLDPPWRPSDMEQNIGRIVRQGNQNEEVYIYRYVTEGTFDAYIYQLLENKQRFTSQIMTSNLPSRSAEDIDEVALDYAEVKMLASGNPLIKEKMDLDIKVNKLNLLKADFMKSKYELENMVYRKYPEDIVKYKTRIAGYENDIELAASNPLPEDGFIGMTVEDRFYDTRTDAGNAILAACKKIKDDTVHIGTYRGFDMNVMFIPMGGRYDLHLKGSLKHYISLGSDPVGNIKRIDNKIVDLKDALYDEIKDLNEIEKNLENAKLALGKSFAQEKELVEMTARLNELNSILNNDTHDEPEEEKAEEKEEPTVKRYKSR